MVHNVQHLAQRLDRGGRIDGDAGPHSVTANELQAAVQVNAGFLMNRNPVRTGIGEGRNVLVGILDHEVAIEGNIDSLAQAGDHGRSDRDIGHEMTVHHVDMQQGSATSQCRVRILR